MQTLFLGFDQSDYNSLCLQNYLSLKLVHETLVVTIVFKKYIFNYLVLLLIIFKLLKLKQKLTYGI